MFYPFFSVPNPNFCIGYMFLDSKTLRLRFNLSSTPFFSPVPFPLYPRWLPIPIPGASWRRPPGQRCPCPGDAVGRALVFLAWKPWENHRKTVEKYGGFMGIHMISMGWRLDFHGKIYTGNLSDFPMKIFSWWVHTQWWWNDRNMIDI